MLVMWITMGLAFLALVIQIISDQMESNARKARKLVRHKTQKAMVQIEQKVNLWSEDKMM